MRWLGIETSCDESAVALVEVEGGALQIRSSLVGSQIARHRPYGGVVPEVAVREHLKNLPQLVQRVLEETGLAATAIDGIAVTQGPGLATSLLIGHSYAWGLGLMLGRPVRGINHLEGHLLSPFFAAGTAPAFPFLGLVVSGGHTLLVEARGWNDYARLGGTVDDAAGEVFDKVARMLGLGYPGGPEIERVARGGNAAAYDFPQSFPERTSFQFSFSGLKTSLRYFLEKNMAQGRLAEPRFVADVAASFQRAVVEVLVRKTLLAARARRLDRITVAGGVACNGALREALARGAAEEGRTLALAPAVLCTDNAAMIAGVAALKQAAGVSLEVDEPDIHPNLPLAVAVS